MFRSSIARKRWKNKNLLQGQTKFTRGRHFRRTPSRRSPRRTIVKRVGKVACLRCETYAGKSRRHRLATFADGWCCDRAREENFHGELAKRLRAIGEDSSGGESFLTFLCPATRSITTTKFFSFSIYQRNRRVTLLVFLSEKHEIIIFVCFWYECYLQFINLFSCEEK